VSDGGTSRCGAARGDAPRWRTWPMHACAIGVAAVLTGGIPYIPLPETSVSPPAVMYSPVPTTGSGIWTVVGHRTLTVTSYSATVGTPAPKERQEDRIDSRPPPPTGIPAPVQRALANCRMDNFKMVLGKPVVSAYAISAGFPFRSVYMTHIVGTGHDGQPVEVVSGALRLRSGLMPCRPLAIGLCLDMAVWYAAMLGVRKGWVMARARSRSRKGLCPRCGYARVDLPVAAQCPECGLAGVAPPSGE